MCSTLSRAVLGLLALGAIAVGGVPAASARTSAMDDIYSMIVDQHAMLLDQHKRIEALEQALGLQKQEIRSLRERATSAESELERSREQLRSIVIPPGERLAALPGQQLAAAPAVAALPVETEGRISASLDVLYMTALSDSFRYITGQAASDAPQSVGQGFRAGAELRMAYALPGGGWSLGAGVRHLQAQRSESYEVQDMAFFDAGAHSDNELRADAGDVVTAESRYHLWQMDLDARYAFGRDRQLSFVAGARYASLKRGLNIEGGDAISTNDANFSGFGPKVGLGAEIPLGGGLRVSGLSTGSLLIGRGEVLSDTDCGCGDPDQTFATKDVRTVPVLDARLAMGYDFVGSQGGFGLKVEAGVQAQHWMNLQDFANPNTDGLGSSVYPIIDDTTMTFAGPFIGLRAWW